MSAAPRSLVIGAGIVGLCCARALLREGHAVTVIDRDPAGDKVSFGNAGGLGVTEILPAATPGVIWQVAALARRSARPAVDPTRTPAAPAALARALPAQRDGRRGGADHGCAGGPAGARLRRYAAALGRTRAVRRPAPRRRALGLRHRGGV